MSLIALITARGGSKEILRKNIKLLAGKPLIAWTINAAKKAKCVNRIIVSTDDLEISEIAKKYGAEVPFLRPVELAKDETPSIDVVLHAIEQMPGLDWLMLLQPTSPLRNASDIDNIFKFCQDNKASSAVSVNEVNKHPYWMYKRDSYFRLKQLNKDYSKDVRRQNLPKIYTLNGALYLAKIDWLKKHRSFIGRDTIGFAMPLKRSVDIDTIHDWNWTEYLIKQKNK